MVAAWKSMDGKQVGDSAKLADALVKREGSERAPPAPMAATISYGPRREPDGRANGWTVPTFRVTPYRYQKVQGGSSCVSAAL